MAEQLYRWERALAPVEPVTQRQREAARVCVREVPSSRRRHARCRGVEHPGWPGPARVLAVARLRAAEAMRLDEWSREVSQVKKDAILEYLLPPRKGTVADGVGRALRDHRAALERAADAHQEWVAWAQRAEPWIGWHWLALPALMAAVAVALTNLPREVQIERDGQGLRIAGRRIGRAEVVGVAVTDGRIQVELIAVRPPDPGDP